MNARTLMLQGTGSDVGKSILVAALCRIAKRRGVSVAPFKPQNMSNNAHACVDGGEIGRAQALQARAAGLEPSVDFNPVLLKPESDQAAQIVVHGKPADRQLAKSYFASRGALLPAVLESFTRLTEQYELVIVEGAGSPAEVNLRDGDIANMGFARAAGVPVCLVGDIDRGGVIAALVGTKTILAPDDAAYIQTFLINKFRGDISLFQDGIRLIEQRTGWANVGVVSWLKSAAHLPAEDAVVLDQRADHSQGTLKIVVPMLSRLANFDDFDPLKMTESVHLEFIAPGKPIPRDADVVILPGTKSTIADLEFLRQHGWHHDLYAHVRQGGRVLGVCGGYQMLGKLIHDPSGADSTARSSAGLGLLDVVTHMLPGKQVKPTSAVCTSSGYDVHGYEIHTGTTSGPDTERPLFYVGDGADGASDVSGRVQGTYLHGLFNNDAYRGWWLSQVNGIQPAPFNFGQAVERALDDLADQVSAECDIEALLSTAQPVGWQPV